MTPPADLVIRPGDARDIAEVMVTMAMAFDAAFGEAWTREQCLSVLAMPGVALILAQRQADAVGFALTRVILDEAELLLLAVRPGSRRQGIAHAMLTAAATAARMRGAARLHLEVRDGNGALDLYRAAGFAPVGRRRAYYRGRDGLLHDAITLSVPLPDQPSARQQ